VGNVAIVTDSNAGIPEELAREMGIQVLAMPFEIGGRTYLDGEMAPEELYAKMESGLLPHTSQPSPGMVADLYKRLRDVASSVISIHVTGEHSGTCQTATLAATLVPELDVQVVDSRGVAMGTGFLALAAARLARLGMAKEEIVARLEAMRERIFTYCTVATVRYLQSSGRLGRLQGALASVLDIKPLITLTDGTLGMVGKVRTRRRSLDELVRLTQEAVAHARSVQLAVMHAGVREDAEALKAQLEQTLGRAVDYLLETPTILAIHGGPGLIGVIACTDSVP
jgi:DegV family protein with EDD domain